MEGKNPQGSKCGSRLFWGVMFRLKFTPDFRNQRDALLAQTTTPAIDLPESIQQSLEGFSDGSPNIVRSGGRLWFESIRAVRPLLWKAAAISLLASICAASSTLAAMQLLRTERDLSSMWMLSIVYFLMNCLSQFAIY